MVDLVHVGVVTVLDARLRTDHHLQLLRHLLPLHGRIVRLLLVKLVLELTTLLLHQLGMNVTVVML